MNNESSATIKDVAALARVSIATVSRVLNDHPSVRAKTRKAVLEAVEQLRYNPNAIARSLKVRHTKTIGIIAPELSNMFFMEVIESLERLLTPKGYSMLISSSNASVEEERRVLQDFTERHVDGLVVFPAGNQGEHFLESTAASTPMIMVDRKVEGIQVDRVITDNRYGVHKMIEALHNEGFTRIGFIGGDPSFYTAKERLDGYYEAMKRLNLPIDPRFVLHHGVMTQKDGFSLFKKALEERDHPYAFFIANEALHLGATTYALSELDEKIANQFVFASFDYLTYSPLLKLCRYAVAQPLERMGSEVATLLLKRLSGDKENYPEHIVLKPEIKIITAHGGKPLPT